MNNTATRTDISQRPIPTVRQAKGNPLLVTIARASESASKTGATRYVFANGFGYEIANEAPAFGQSYWEFDGNGGAWKVA